MFFIQLPPSLPAIKHSASTEGEEKAESSRTSVQGCSLDELPAGFMGKMLVYRSGAIKLKLGDSLYDVSAKKKRKRKKDTRNQKTRAHSLESIEIPIV